jgi:adenylate kinase
LQRPLTPGIIIAGPPAGGKGSQCERIVAAFGVVHISTGDLLRAEVKAQTENGKKADECMKAGQLVPDDLIISMVRDRLNQPDVRERGWLLDGFPRTAFQAVALNKAGIVPAAFVLLEVPDQVVSDRVTGRRNDPVTGKVYHLTFNPPPNDDAVLKRLEHRKDDTKEAIVARLATYHKNLDDIVDLYTSVMCRVDGNRSMDVIGKDVVAMIKERLLK